MIISRSSNGNLPKRRDTMDLMRLMILTLLRRGVMFILILGTIGLTSCASIVVRQAYPIIEETERVMLNERNETIVKDALPFAIKLTEGLYVYSPSARYASKLSFLYGAYALAYFDEGPYSDFDFESDEKIEASRYFYNKSFEYAVLALKKRHKDFEKSLYSPATTGIWLAELKPRDYEALFWLDFSWAMLLILDLSNVQTLSHTETILKIAEHLCAFDPEYLAGGCYAILMAYYGGRSQAIGGNIEQAQLYYDAAKDASAGKSLIPYYVYMRFVAPEQGDRAGFLAAAAMIDSYEFTDGEEFAFINAFIKRKAAALMARQDDLF